MLSLNPEKLLIVLIVALVLLGPDKLPKVARQVGEGWSKLRAFQQRIESEVRESMPDLPSSHEIARIARSPLSYLTTMAGSDDSLVPDPSAPSNGATAQGGAWPVDPASPHGAPSSNGHAPPEPTLVRPVGMPGHQVPADPGMN
jgi:sec-independent protein translocase protein TatB